MYIRNLIQGLKYKLFFKEGKISLRVGNNSNCSSNNDMDHIDNRLIEIMSLMKELDVLVINADHGCDSMTKSTDHFRKYIPILMYGKQIAP